MSVAIVFIDVDGTLLGSSGDVPPEVWTAAERVRAAGIHLALCSGRPGFGVSREYARRLDPDGWHVFQNGASVVHLASGRSRSKCMDPALLRRLIDASREWDLPLELYSDSDYVVENPSFRSAEHARLLEVPFRPRDLLSFDQGVVRAQWLLSDELPEPDWTVFGTELSIARSVSPVMPGTRFVNITPPGVSKASGVLRVADAYGVAPEQAMMVGDAENDLEAMSAVGWPVAMGNASPEVKAAAKDVVAHVDGLGLVEALELTLPPEPDGRP